MRLRRALAVGVAIFGVALIYNGLLDAVEWWSPKTKAGAGPSAERKLVSVGEEVGSLHLCFAAVDDAAWELLTEADAAKDSVGLANLLVAERAFRLKQGDRALILDKGFTSIKVRALSGQGAGKSGWVYRECVEQR